MNNLKVAIVTGGSRGIGASIVKKLASNNFIVILNYNKSKKSAEEIAKSSPNVYTFKADVSNSTECDSLINYTIDKFGSIDLLVNNAGVDLIKTVDDISDSEFDHIMKTNIYSAFYLSRAVSKIMITQKKGSIINISSIWGLVGASCESAYSISKAGLDALTKSLAKELGPSNIRVNSIAPGIIDTSMNSFLSEEDKNEIISDIPLMRIGNVDDVSDCVLFLANSSYISGQVLKVDGGWNII